MAKIALELDLRVESGLYIRALMILENFSGSPGSQEPSVYLVINGIQREKKKQIEKKKYYLQRQTKLIHFTKIQSKLNKTTTTVK